MGSGCVFVYYILQVGEMLGKGEWGSELFFKWSILNNQEFGCDGIWLRAGV